MTRITTYQQKRQRKITKNMDYPRKGDVEFGYLCGEYDAHKIFSAILFKKDRKIWREVLQEYREFNETDIKIIREKYEDFKRE